MNKEQEIKETKEEVVEEQPEVAEENNDLMSGFGFSLDVEEGYRMLGIEDY